MAPALGALQSVIERVGAYAGIAAMLGIAVLALLYFAQAREVRRLREWAGRSPERAQELEERVAAQADAARLAAAPAPVPVVATAPAAVAAPAAPAPSAVLQPAPAGVGAPALASATRFPGLVRPAPAPAPAPVSPAPLSPSPSPVPSSVPVTTAAPVPVPAAQTAAARTAPGNGRGAPPPARTAPPARIPVRPRPAPVAAGARMPTASPRRGRGLRAALVVGALLLVAGAAFAVTQLTGGSDTKKQPATRATPVRHAGQSFARGSVVVAVLNGTPQAGVAHQVSARLVRDGFRQGQVTNAPDQQRSATVVAYFPGHRREAAEVGRALKLKANVEAIDSTTRAIVCPQPQCATTVVVTVGSDVH